MFRLVTVCCLNAYFTFSLLVMSQFDSNFFEFKFDGNLRQALNACCDLILVLKLHILSLGGLFDCQLLCVVPQIFFHDDYESLHEHVSPSALPEDYDGDKPPVDSARLVSEFLDPRNDRLSGR